MLRRLIVPGTLFCATILATFPVLAEELGDYTST
jgi:hypothetical protein